MKDAYSYNYKNGKPTVFTNGCFYLLHAGHVALFKKIKELYPTYCLIVGLNSNKSYTFQNKENRPVIMSDEERFLILSSIKYVDNVIFFDEETPIELIKKIKPDILVKGIDYHNKEIVGSDIAKVVSLVNFEYNVNTSDILLKIRDMY